MRLALLCLANIANTALFWMMWNGFYFHGDFAPLKYVASIHFMTTLFSFLAYLAKDSRIAVALTTKDLVKSEQERQKLASRSFLVASFVLAASNLVVAITAYLFNGSIDIWFSGHPT